MAVFVLKVCSCYTQKTLIGHYLVERISSTPFDCYVQVKICAKA